MTSRFKMTVAAAALLAGTGFAYAQGTGMGQGGAGGGANMQQSAPSSERGGAAERGGATQQMNRSTTQGMGEEKSPAAGSNQRAEDSMKGDKSKSMSSENEGKGASKDKKAEGREDKNNMKAEGRQGTENRSQTVGQAGAGAKLSTEQRTKITTVIRNERVAPVTNVNFNISVGTRVPRDIAFHPLPADVVTIYPEWRGYNFVLVRDEIIVIDPSTYEIVAVINS